MHHLSDLFVGMSALGPIVYLLIFVVSLFESTPILGTFTPGALIMIYFGMMAGDGHSDLMLTVLAAWSGSFCGDYVGYGLGRYGGAFLARHKKWIPHGYLTAGNMFFTKHGAKSLVFGRFVALIRPIISLFAGASEMRAGSFALWNAIGALAWSGVYIALGFFFGNQYWLVRSIMRTVGTTGLVVLLIVGVGFYIYRERKIADDTEAMKF